VIFLSLKTMLKHVNFSVFLLNCERFEGWKSVVLVRVLLVVGRMWVGSVGGGALVD